MNSNSSLSCVYACFRAICTKLWTFELLNPPSLLLKLLSIGVVSAKGIPTLKSKKYHRARESIERI